MKLIKIETNIYQEKDKDLAKIPPITQNAIVDIISDIK